MSRRLALALVLTVVLPASARAQTSYEARIRTALDTVSRGDRDGGVRGLREAIADSPSRPEAICYLAETFRMAGDLTGAIDNFNMCLNVARSANDRGFVARAMHGVASTYERMPDEHLNDAREAWLAYQRYCEANPTVGHATLGRDRVTAIDTVLELNRVSAEVRGRIEERARAAAAAPPPSASSSPASSSRSRR
jgi:hypothetical protein